MGGRENGKTALPPDIAVRPESPADEGFLFALFASHTAPTLAHLPLPPAMAENLIRMQFASQTASYRAAYPRARFEVLERNGVPLGRQVIDEGGDAGCVVDFALLPGAQGGGLGTAAMTAVVARFAELGRPVRCKVMMHNAASLRMCEKAGFSKIGEEPPFMDLEWRPSR